jgi:hypothetical protein
VGDEERLLELNQLTFDAESRPDEPIAGQSWDAFLSGVLADNFIARRAKPSLSHQSRKAFVAFARDASDAPRNIVSEPVVWVGGGIGVVACDVRLGDDDTVRFRNVKVFERQGDWRCVYWQVTSFNPGTR